MAEPDRAIPVTDRVLAAHALPPLRPEADKEARGRVLVIGGSAQTPGAVILAGVAALRAGAGKLQIVTAAPAALPVAVALPEARVIAQRQTAVDGLHPEFDEEVRSLIAAAHAVLVGPGLLGGADGVAAVVAAVMDAVEGATVVLDASAVLSLREAPDLLARVQGRAVLTPNPYELALVMGTEPAPGGEGDPDALQAAARQFGTAVVSGPVAGDAELVVRETAGGPGLGTSGSGDVRSGIVAGMAARGARPRTAAIWGGHLHARAGDRLVERVGLLGFLARELLDEVPRELSMATARLRGV